MYKLRSTKTLLVFIITFQSITCLADPPKPPLGKRWVLNKLYSDEFNGTELDRYKWLDYHPTWKGRAPGLFMASQVKVENGYLTIKGEKWTKKLL